MKSLYKAICIFTILIAAAAFGCASKNVGHGESITGADLAIKEARTGNATVNAPLELKLAEEKLSSARAAAEKEEFLKAKRLADEALMDAKLAEAKSLSEKTKKQAQEMRDSIEALRREIERMQMQK